jgi:hypothetical protein
MDNPETLETLGTQKTHDEDEQNTKTKKISNTESFTIYFSTTKHH